MLATSHGDLYLTVALDGDGDPFEVFGRMGKSGTFEQGVTELACRLISLHLRRGTPVEDVVDQCRGVGGMEPRLNRLPGGRSVFVQGLGDGIAHILQGLREGRTERRESVTTRTCSTALGGRAGRRVRAGRLDASPRGAHNGAASSPTGRAAPPSIKHRVRLSPHPKTQEGGPRCPGQLTR